MIGLILVPFSAFSQSNVLETTRTWTSYENIDLYSNQSLSDTFNIHLSSTMVKLVSNGREREFAVSNIEGSWSQFNQPGELTFDVQVRDLTGKGRLQRLEGVLSMVIDLSERKDWMKRKFILNEQ